MSSPEQLSFRAAHLQKEVSDVIRGWLEDGAPLGLDLPSFKRAFGLSSSTIADSLFQLFDTDRNQKVDAFEVLAASILLAEGSLEEKIETLFLIFDFSGVGRLNFDEVNILAHGVCRGVGKVCRFPLVGDEELVQVCRLAFDAHNLPYDKQISKEQVKRWMRNDMEATAFLDSVQRAVLLPDVQALLKQRQEEQVAAVSAITSGLPMVEDVVRNEALRRSLGQPPEKALVDFARALSGPTGAPNASKGRILEVSRAWNVFTVLDPEGLGSVDCKDLGPLLWLLHGHAPSEQIVEDKLDLLKLQPGDRLTRMAWLLDASTPP